MTKRITIAGLGWLGQPLASHLKLYGYQVKGSVTDTEKAKALTKSGITAYPVVLAEAGVSGLVDTLLVDTDVLMIMIPPGLRRNTGANYALKMAHFLHQVEKSQIEKVILVSSTSVYDDSQGVVTEKIAPRPETNAGKQLHDVEQIFFNNSAFKTTVVRFGGLFGGSRNPVKFLAGRKGLTNGKAPVNMIHRDDCIGILMTIIKQDAFGHIINAVAPSHPSKKKYYTQQAQELGLEPPEYIDEDTATFKEVNSVVVKPVLNYEFQVDL